MRSGSVKFGFYTSKSSPGTPPEVCRKNTFQRVPFQKYLFHRVGYTVHRVGDTFHRVGYTFHRVGDTFHRIPPTHPLKAGRGLPLPPLRGGGDSVKGIPDSVKGVPDSVKGIPDSVNGVPDSVKRYFWKGIVPALN